MAEKLLVIRPLTEDMREGGEKLLRLLQKRQFPFRAALWLYMSEAEEWRLFLAVPKARKEGKMKFYKKLQSAVSKEPGLPSFLELAVVDAKDPLAYSLGRADQVGNIKGHQFSRGTINGRYFADAYVYRLAN
jgi:hypothetical protein